MAKTAPARSWNGFTALLRFSSLTRRFSLVHTKKEQSFKFLSFSLETDTHPAIDGKNYAGNKACCRGREINGGPPDIVRCPQAGHGCSAENFLQTCRIARKRLSRHLGLDPTGR